MASTPGAPFPAPRENTSLMLFWRGRFWPLRGTVRGLARTIQEHLRRQEGYVSLPDSVAIFKATQLVRGADGCVGGNKITHVIFGPFSRGLDAIFTGVGWAVAPRPRPKVSEPGLAHWVVGFRGSFYVNSGLGGAGPQASKSPPRVTHFWPFSDTRFSGLIRWSEAKMAREDWEGVFALEAQPGHLQSDGGSEFGKKNRATAVVQACLLELRPVVLAWILLGIRF